MNRTTPKQRAVWIQTAARLIELNEEGVCTNMQNVVSQLIKLYSISRASANTATVHAIMRARREMWGK